MRRVIRKYNDFVKSKSVNEDMETIITPESAESEEGFDRTEELDVEDSANIIDSEEDVDSDGYDGEEEEESGEYHGTQLLNKLADMLGTKVSDNRIDYEGNKINYYSETDMFHVGKSKFKTPEEVVEFLKGSDEIVESRRPTRRRN